MESNLVGDFDFVGGHVGVIPRRCTWNAMAPIETACSHIPFLGYVDIDRVGRVRDREMVVLINAELPTAKRRSART